MIPMNRTAADLALGESGVLEVLAVAPDVATRLMEHGFLPGASLVPVREAPGGGSRVFRVDGSDVALRLDTARQLVLLLKP
jgi:ferrous iron transport protein A